MSSYVFVQTVGYCFPKTKEGTVPLYRYYKKRSRNTLRDHFYTTDENEIGTTTFGQEGKGGYISEGIACYVYPACYPLAEYE